MLSVSSRMVLPSRLSYTLRSHGRPPARHCRRPVYGAHCQLLLDHRCGLSRFSCRAEAKQSTEGAQLHNPTETHCDPITYGILHAQFLDMDAKDWNRDASTLGAFPYFGSGVFQNLYNSLTYPVADMCPHFGGDVTSTCHARVVRTLDSAWKAVFEYICVTRQYRKMWVFMEPWSGNAEWTSLRQI
ncbi:hypothetical protein EDD17DRAFT_646096 [Pisolithus thermaeus]|nr:hypothetical protein EDD17DRAFT_646096 [Pisolithus thermaeus]